MGCVRRASHQETVEEHVDEDAQAADDEVEEVVEELEVQHHGLVAAREGPAVPHEAHQEDDLVTHLEGTGSVTLSRRGHTDSRSWLLLFLLNHI